ncbi:MAG: hypothetical protein JSW07_06915 [bacterium]|nr:MAG: hypothetical protein JSW07_06915 [bacterium]
MKDSYRLIAMFVSLTALIVIFYKAISVFVGVTTFDSYILWTGIATITWFVISPIWLWKR